MSGARPIDRAESTLSLLLVSPTLRVPLFLGRALLVIVNGSIVPIMALAVGTLLLGVNLTAGLLAPLALTVAVATFSCTGLGLISVALALCVREIAAWMSAVASWLPLTHGIDAARKVANGASISAIQSDLLAEVGLGALYILIGLKMLAIFEREIRRNATLEAY